MIIPVGHESDFLKSPPYVTFAIMIICTVIWASQATRFNTTAQIKESELLVEIDQYAKAHDYLDVPDDVNRLRKLLVYNRPMAEMEEMLEEMQAERQAYEDALAGYDEYMRGLEEEEEEPELTQEEEQAHLDGLIARFRKVSLNLEFFNWGYVPAQQNINGMFAHMFLHAGFFHLLGNMIFLYLFGALIEDRYGRAFFGGFFIVGGMFAGFMWGLHYADSEIPLVGASGAVFAVLGGYLIKNWRDKIRFVFIFLLRGKMFSMPAWVAVPFWFIKELAFGLMLDNASGVAHFVHVWGFVFGAGIILALSASGLEKRFWPPVIDLNAPEENGNIRMALKEERLGNFDKALQLLRTGCREDPDDLDMLQNYWRVAREKRRLQDMLIAGQKLMNRDVDENQAQMAHVRFKEILEAQSDARFSPALINRLATALAHDRYYVEAEEILRHGYNTLPNPTARVLFPMLEVAAIMQCEFGLEIAERLRSAEGFSQWEETDALVKQIEDGLKSGGLAADDSISITGGGMSLDLADAHEFMDMGPPPKNVHSLKVFDAIPKSISREGLTLDVGGQDRQIPYGKIKLVAVGAIREEGKKPYLIIDLVFDRPQDVLPQHRVLRLTSHTFNPLKLMPKMEKAGAAFRRLVEIVLKSSGGDAAPSRDAAVGKPYQNFPNVRAYERTIYYE